MQELLAEAVQDRVVLRRRVFGDRFEPEYPFTLSIDSHPFEGLTLVWSDIWVKVPPLHLQDGWPLVREGVESLDQSRAHKLLLAIEVFADVFQLVDRVELHRCHVRWIKDVLEYGRKATLLFEVNQGLLTLEVLLLFLVLEFLLNLLLLQLFWHVDDSLGGFLFSLLICLCLPGEEQAVQLLHHQRVRLERRVDVHRVVVDELLEEDFLLFVQ